MLKLLCLLSAALLPISAHALPLIPVLASLAASAGLIYASTAFVISIASAAAASGSAKRRARRQSARNGGTS
jgi:hypothetical protein